MVEKTILALLKGELEATFRELDQKPSEILEVQEVGESKTEQSTETSTNVVNVTQRQQLSKRIEESAKMSVVPEIPRIQLIEISELLSEALLSICPGEYFIDASDLFANNVSWNIMPDNLILVTERTSVTFGIPIGVLSMVIKKMWDYAPLSEPFMEWLLQNDIPEPMGEPDVKTLKSITTVPSEIYIIIDYYLPYLALKKGKDCIVLPPEDFASAMKLLKSMMDKPRVVDIISDAGLVF